MHDSRLNSYVPHLFTKQLDSCCEPLAPFGQTGYIWVCHTEPRRTSCALLYKDLIGDLLLARLKASAASRAADSFVPTLSFLVIFNSEVGGNVFSGEIGPGKAAPCFMHAK